MTLAESTILVVDDEPVLRFTFSILLKQSGATVHAAGNGLEALQLATQYAFDLILTDKQMPKMDGLTLLRTLREQGVTAPAVFFVNGAVPEEQAEMDRLGVQRTITKPLHPVDLIQALESVLETVPGR